MKCVGEVLRELRGGQRRRQDAYGGRLRVWPPPQAPGEAPASDPDSSDSFELEFSGEDVDPACNRLAVGDTVHVWVVTDAKGGRRGTGILLSRDPTAAPRAVGGAAAGQDVAAGGGESPGANGAAAAEGDIIAASAAQGRDVGRVATLRDSYGFVRVHPSSGGPASRDAEVPNRLFFHFSQVEGGFANLHIAEGTDVSFTVAPDRRSGKITAQNVRVLPRGSLPAEGRKAAAEAEPPVLSRADASTSWARSTPLPTRGGGGGDGGPAPDAAAAAVAAPVRWDHPDCELGVILTVRVKYGFIRCVERPSDLFFHIDTAVQDGVPREELKPGRDVAFIYGSDPRDASRPVATRLRLAPAGAAVFDDVATERLLGVVVQRIPTAKQPWPAGGGAKPGGDGPQMGSIEYLPPGAAGSTEPPGGEAVQPPPVASEAAHPGGDASNTPEAVDDPDLAPGAAAGETEDGGGGGSEAVKAEGGTAAPPAPGAVRIPFGTSDLLPDTHPRPGDIVEFSIATHRRTQAQHASRVGLPLRTGVVAVVKPNYGFIQPTDGLQLPTGVGSKAAKSGKASATVFYHDSEVTGHVALAPRDEVEFLCCLNPKTGDPNARRVRRTKEAPLQPQPAARHGRDGGEPAQGAEPRPEALRRDREPGSMVGRQATARVVEGPAPGQPGFTFGRGKALGITYGVQSSLRVSAPPFQPPAAEAGPAGGDTERHADAE